MDAFTESVFREKINRALESVKKILETNRQPLLPADVSHQYQDKYALSEWVTRSAISAIKNVLLNIISEKDFNELLKASEKRSVSLRFTSEERCTFIKKAEREEESATKSVHKSTLFGTSKSFTVTKITEWFWKMETNFAVSTKVGTDEDKVVIQRDARTELITTVETSPYPSVKVRDPIDVDITWILQQISNGFKINRDSDKCRTPSRNPETAQALLVLGSLNRWANSVKAAFVSNLFPIQKDHGLDLTQINSKEIFSPVLPLFEKRAAVAPSPRSSRKHHDKDEEKKKKKEKSKVVAEDTFDSLMIPVDFMDSFLAEQKRTIHEKLKVIEKAFPAPSSHKIISAKEAELGTLTSHIGDIVSGLTDAIGYIEFLLWNQLIAAIGKQVQEKDVQEYLKFHSRLLFNPAYAPKAFAYAVRFESSSPEGTLTIVDGDNQPLQTIVNSRLYGNAGMTFPLSASSKATFYGERFIHGAILPKFSVGSSPGKLTAGLTLQARARQFSSFILLVGRIAGPDLFEPKQALYLANKDDLKVPLLLETLPTAKQFRDAISSISPEQQRFAKAYRQLQLESTLFGIAIIQVKPQLEKLLKLPPMSLIKEIGLTQQLLELLTKYQVPSDLLSFAGEPSASTPTKVETVRGYVTKMFDTINGLKKKDLDEAQESQDYRFADDDIRRSSDYEKESSEGSASGSGSADWNDVDESDYEEEDDHDDGESFSSSVIGKVQSFFGGMAKSAAPMRSAAAPRMQRSAVRSDAVMKKSIAAPMDSEEMVSGKTARHHRSGGEPPKPPSEGKPLAGREAAKPTESKPSSPNQTTPDPNVGDRSDEAEPMEIELVSVDYTKLPSTLEQRFDLLDTDGTVRPTIINTGESWKKEFKASLLSDPTTITLENDELGVEKNKAFDLLDALTKSGVLPIDHASLHVVVAATHCFNDSVMNTLIKDNINPIEKLERTALIMASTIHDASVEELIKKEQVERVATYSPALLPEHAPKPADPLALPSSSSKQSLLPGSISSEKLLKVKK